MQKEQDFKTGVQRPCQCEDGGNCFRAMHKAGTKCDRTVFLTRASRHRICKGCRSAKKRKNVSSGLTANSSNVAKSAPTERTNVASTLSIRLPTVGEIFEGGPDSLVAPDTFRSLGLDGGEAYAAGSFQPMFTSGVSPPTSARSPRWRESFPLSTSSAVDEAAYKNIPGMAPVNYASVGAGGPENKKRRQPPRVAAANKRDEYYYNEAGSSQSKRYKADYSESRAILSNLTTRNGDTVQLLPCVCTKGGFCHRPEHKVGLPCDSICRISKNVRHRVCKGCRSGGKGFKGKPVSSVRAQASVLGDENEIDTETEGDEDDYEDEEDEQYVQDEQNEQDGMELATQTLSSMSSARFIKDEALKADEEVEKETFEKLNMGALKQDGEVLIRRGPECQDDYSEAHERSLLNSVDKGPIVSTARDDADNTSSVDSRSTTGSRSKASKEDAELLSSMLTSKFRS